MKEHVGLLLDGENKRCQTKCCKVAFAILEHGQSVESAQFFRIAAEIVDEVVAWLCIRFVAKITRDNLLTFNFCNFVNPCGESDQLIVYLNFAKKWLSEAKQKARSEASRKKSKFEIF